MYNGIVDKSILDAMLINVEGMSLSADDAKRISDAQKKCVVRAGGE